MTATKQKPASVVSTPAAPSRPISQKNLDRVAAVGLPVLAIGIFLTIWEVLAGAALLGTLPGPLQVLQDGSPLITGFFNNSEGDVGLFWQLATSLQRVALGYTLAAVIGVSLGILMGSFKPMQLALDPIFQVLRTVPPLAWLPLALAALSQASPSAIFVIFITAVWPIIINTAVGVRSTPQDYRNVASVLKLSRTTYFFQILLPSAAGYIFTGLRIAVGLAWLAIVAAEMLTGGIGIGFFIWDAYNSSRMADIILAILCVGLVGFALDRLVHYLGKWLVVSE